MQDLETKDRNYSLATEELGTNKDEEIEQANSEVVPYDIQNFSH